MKKRDIKELTLEELEGELQKIGEKKFRAKQIYEWIHKKLAMEFNEMTNLSKSLRERLAAEYLLDELELLDTLTSRDESTSKYLFRLKKETLSGQTKRDARGVLRNGTKEGSQKVGELTEQKEDSGIGGIIESVLMKYHHGNSVCISSQAGCRMGCRFCASTLNGLDRNLSASEMLDQIYHIQKQSGERVSNVVVMGTGEPLDNYEELLRFIHMISDEKGLNISQRNLTVSTCGLVENIYRLAEENLQITLAISLHAPNDEIRQKLMPVANRYRIKEILKACDVYYQKTGRRISFEYSLVAGVNDSVENAAKLAELLHGRNCHVNLIPVNAIKEREFHHGTDDVIQKFKLVLEKEHINVTIRREMGADINAACGQLRKSYMDG